jgi:hypothetical protein
MKKGEICLETLRLAEQLERIVQHFVEKHQPRAEAVVSTASVWMTEIQLAEYWQLRNKDGEPTVHSIRRWTARPDNPLPCGNLGEIRRYHKDDVDRWAREEAERQRKPNKQKGRNRLHAVGG